jgi:RNA polymerase sigma factor (sigma-70 family)
MEDVFRDWDAKIARTILDAGIPYDSVDDVKSEIYLSMVRRDLCQKFDPARAASFSTYLYKIVHSLISNQFRDLYRKKNIPTSKILSLGIDAEFDDTELFSHTLHAYIIMDEIEKVDFVNRVLEELENPENHQTIWGKDGKTMSLRDAVLMMFKGYSIQDIADSIGAKSWSIKKGLQNLKTLTWISDYRNTVEA